MATTLLNESYNIGAYNSAGSSLNNRAYTFRVEVLLNSQNDDNLTSNVTINWYIKGNSGWYYTGYSDINTYISVRNITMGDSDYINKATGTYNSMPGSGTEYKMLSWTGDVQGAQDGTLKFNVGVYYDGGQSKNVLPRAHSKNWALTNIPTIEITPNVVFNGAKFNKIMFATDSANAVKIKKIYFATSATDIIAIK